MMPEALEHRAATEADLPGLLEVVKQNEEGRWTPGAFLSELRLQWSHVEVLAEESVPARIWAFMIYWRVDLEYELLNIAVHPSARRKGLGHRLLQALLDTAAKQQRAVVHLEVRRTNTAALALYRRCGFEVVGMRRGYYSASGDDALLMTWKAE